MITELRSRTRPLVVAWSFRGAFIAERHTKSRFNTIASTSSATTILRLIIPAGSVYHLLPLRKQSHAARYTDDITDITDHRDGPEEAARSTRSHNFPKARIFLPARSLLYKLVALARAVYQFLPISIYIFYFYFLPHVPPTIRLRAHEMLKNLTPNP
jgi:hypothetical protein